jgi:hypothetical protein
MGAQEPVETYLMPGNEEEEEASGLLDACLARSAVVGAPRLAINAATVRL